MNAMRRRGRLFLCCLVLMLLASTALGDGVAPSGGKVFLWTVRSEKGVSYLLGSIHLLKKEMYPLDGRIEEAFAGSGALAVETDIGPRESEKLGRLVSEHALYPEGDTLEKHVSPDTYDLVRRKLHSLGMARVDRMRPWALALAAANIEYMKMGLDPGYGIDRYFLDKADGRKKVVGLEAYDYVVNLLRGLPEGIQDLFLFYTLTDLDTAGGEVGAILSSWRTGDVKGMEEVVYRSREEYPKLLPVYEILVSRRNRTMTDKIEGLLAKGETYFIVVGAAHLVGEDGIIERLKEKGYEVEQR
jgi:uncharacterized protein YbaP (TraB family)